MDKSRLLLTGAFLVMGISTSLAFLFFVNASEYYNFKFRNLNNTNETSELQILYESYFSITTATSSLAAVLANALLTGRLSCFRRMISGHLMLFTGMLATAVLTRIDTDAWQNEFFDLTLALIIVANFGSSFIAGAVTGLAATLPRYCMKVLIFAQAFSGLIASMTDLVAIASGKNVLLTSLFYFSFGSVLVLLSLLAFFGLHYSGIHKRLLPRKSINADYATGVSEVSGEDRPILTDTDDFGENASDAHHDPGGVEHLLDTEVEVKLKQNQKKCNIFAIIKKTFPYGSSMVVLFIINAALYPPLLARVQTEHTGTRWAEFFTAVVCFFLSNLTSSIGIVISWFIQKPKFGRTRLTFLLNVLRLVFIPLVLFCNVQPRHHLPVLIKQDEWFALIAGIQAFTASYFICLLSVYLPRTVEKHEAESAGSLISVYVMIGIVIGPLVSVALLKSI